MHKLEKNLNRKAIIQHVETENESHVTNADITKANLLGYQPKTNFEDGIDFF